MPDEPEITELDPTTVERIAAGEVVERPASVVKELVENSIDADADRVEVTVEAGGTESIRVADDGRGMTEAAVRRAVEQHTTSKIADIGDLEGGVGTLGFRGEALHAIGAVSRMTVRTRPRSDRTDGGDEAADPSVGTELVVEGGEVTDVSPVGCPEGTVVEVTDLFYNVPARRKYLKTDSTEFAHVNRVVSGYALANPDVAVSLTHDDRETFATTGDGDLQAAVMSVYGREVARSMIRVSPNDLPEGPLEGVEGLVSHPETNRASREYLSTFVNGRYVTAGGVREAIVDAYDTQLAPDRYPFAVLDLQVDPGEVDVNVHPRKLDVRFADEAAMGAQVEAAVSAALMREGLVRTRAPRGRSAADETAVRSEDRDEGSGDTEDDAGGGRSAGESAARTEGRSDPAGDRIAEKPGDDLQQGAAAGSAHGSPRDDHASAKPGADAGDREATEPVDAGRRFRGAGTQVRLDDPDEPAAATREDFETLPSMRLLGQFQETYLVGETDDGLVLIDQHAADERINYERLGAALDGDVTTQALAEPVSLSVTPGEREAFEVTADALARLGFRAGVEDDETLTVRTVPDLVAEAADPSLLRDVLGEVVREGGSPAETVEAAAEELLADLACYPSITGNTSLASGSALALLERLDECENPWACPHGRPTVLAIETGEIEARFERDYPGHHG